MLMSSTMIAKVPVQCVKSIQIRKFSWSVLFLILNRKKFVFGDFLRSGGCIMIKGKSAHLRDQVNKDDACITKALFILEESVTMVFFLFFQWFP